MHAFYLAGFLVGGAATAIGRTEDNLLTPGSSSGIDGAGFLFLCLLSVLVFVGYLLARCVSLFCFNDPTKAQYFLAGGLITDLLIFGVCLHVSA